MKRIIEVLLVIAIFSNAENELSANGTAGENANFETNYIIDMPTAGILAKGYYSVYMNFFSGGGLASEFVIAPFININLGIGFSSTNFIGSGDINSPDIPSFNLKARILDEKLTLPAIVIGVNTFGRGNFSRASKRFEVMSPGIYAVASKSFESLLGFSYLHIGLGYSLEPKPHDRTPNLFFGAEQTLGQVITLTGELNFNFHESHPDLDKKAIVSTSIRFSPTTNITLELQIRDLLENIYGYGVQRGFVIEFIKAY